MKRIRQEVMPQKQGEQELPRRGRSLSLVAAGLALALAGNSLAWADEGSIAARLQAVEDQAAIEKLVTSDYSTALDTEDWNAFGALFTADAEFRLLAKQFPPREYKGNAAIQKSLIPPSELPAGEVPPGARASIKHVITNPHVQLDGDRATATSYWMEVMIGEDLKPSVRATGYYRDVLKRDNGRWKFQTREVFAYDMAPVAGSEPSMAAPAPRCDEACLRTAMDVYLDAMTAHKPAAVPRAIGFRFTENGVAIPLGEGLWSTAQGPVGYRIYIPDPATDTIAFIGSVKERGRPVFLAVRLRLVDGKVIDAETGVSRGSPFPDQPGAVARASFAELTPAADRLPRRNLVQISEKYFDALQAGNGDLAPFHPACIRIENGVQTTGIPRPGGKPPESCYDNIQHIAPLANITKRRVLAVDETRNLVLLVADFSMPGTDSPQLAAWKKANPPEMSAMVEQTVRPSSGPLFELFRIRHGKIAEIEAVFYGPRMPYGFGTGWD